MITKRSQQRTRERRKEKYRKKDMSKGKGNQEWFLVLSVHRISRVMLL